MSDSELPLPTGPRPSPDRLAWLLSGMAKVGRTSVDLHVYDELRAEVDALRARVAELEAFARWYMDRLLSEEKKP